MKYEAELSATIAKTTIIPVALAYQSGLAETIRSVEAVNKTQSTASRKLLKEVSKKTEEALSATDKLKAEIATGSVVKMKAGMKALRSIIDSLEEVVPAEQWPLPSYAEMLFLT